MQSIKNRARALLAAAGVVAGLALAAGCGGGGTDNRVEEDTTPPTVADAAVSPTTLRFYGGQAHISASVTDNRAALTVAAAIAKPDGSTETVPMALQSGSTFAADWTAPANTAGTTAAAYTFTVVAVDGSDNRTDSSPMTVTVEALPQPPTAPTL